jgi:hypothetical protein
MKGCKIRRARGNGVLVGTGGVVFTLACGSSGGSNMNASPTSPPTSQGSDGAPNASPDAAGDSGSPCGGPFRASGPTVDLGTGGYLPRVVWNGTTFAAFHLEIADPALNTANLVMNTLVRTVRPRARPFRS